MRAILGIGNPGEKYKNTRHNVGFMVVDRLAEEFNVQFKLKRDSLIGKCKTKSGDFYLIKPLTYVNLVGRVAYYVVNSLKVKVEDFLVIVDDFQLNLGEIRFKKRGSSGGHYGLEDIILQIGREEFPRIRIGIGPKKGEGREFVLEEFSEEELKKITKVINNLIPLLQEFGEKGVDGAMDLYSKKRWIV